MRRLPVCSECPDFTDGKRDGNLIRCAKENNCSRFEDWLHRARDRNREVAENHENPTRCRHERTAHERSENGCG